MVPCLIFEDEHLLVVNKPASWNTHAPAPYAGEGLYDWLRHREPRWASLAIIHRLDKETSGVLVFSKTALANQSLTQQFTDREVKKEYVLVTDRPVSRKELTVRSSLVRAGERYVRSSGGRGALAETRFGLAKSAGAPLTKLTAEPLTGRTHQIRVHAADAGFPILGDTLYGGTPAARVFLHAAKIRLKHPASGEEVEFAAPVEFERDPRQALREALLDTTETTCWRALHGAADNRPGWYVDRLGDYVLAQTNAVLSEAQNSELSDLIRPASPRSVYHKLLDRQIRRTTVSNASPHLLCGHPAPGPFTVQENGLSFELSFQEGYSTGLFLDQRDNRRRLLTGYIGPDFSLRENTELSATASSEVLNTFAYTCAFSVCAAKAGRRVTSLDLSKKYLEWGCRNFLLNGLNPAEHDFIFGDVFDWLKRLAKKNRRFGVILLDPPTFSSSKQSGAFRAEKDYGKLVSAALPLLERGGVLFASCNMAGWPAEEFLESTHDAVRQGGRKIVQEQYLPQPPDFPITRAEPAYLKTVWLRVQ